MGTDAFNTEKLHSVMRSADDGPFQPLITGEPDELYAKLVNQIQKYHPSDDLSQIKKAYRIAREAHHDQRRKSGEPYIIHPLCVAIILAELELDKESIIAGILHDVVEDTTMTYNDIDKEFGNEVSLLVDGVTKLTKLSWSSDKTEIQAENLRKMFLAMAKDIRVILIKLADRLHNMRTLQFMPEHKQREKARETMDIYSPLAQRLGISRVKIELDDLALKYLEPEIYYDLLEQLAARQSEREGFIEDIKLEVTQHIIEADINAIISGRIKHLFSIYKKMINQKKTLDQIYDVFAVRIIIKGNTEDGLKDCYAALGIIHEMYKPIPGRFKDYIAMPKPNMYQSLHTTVISNTGQPFEIQIRTEEMHRTAEYGIAAHWKYKEGGGGNLTQNEEAKLSWLRQILEWQTNTSDNKEFLSFIKSDLDLFSDTVFCFTPEGDVKNLPKGSTPIDFAYSIHSAVGNKMVGAKVNGRLVQIDYELKNGDQIEILTSQNSKGPSRDWLQVVKSTQAKSKINQWFKTEFKEENIVKGRELIEKYCRSRGIVWADINKPEYVSKVLRKYGFKDWEAVLAALGHGGLKEGQVINKMLDEYKHDLELSLTDSDVLDDIKETKDKPKRRGSQDGIVVKGVHDLAVRFSRCCNPVPGDEIIGFVTRGRGVSIHRTDCINIINLPERERNRLIEAEWGAEANDMPSASYSAEIKIYCQNRLGIAVDITRAYTEMKIEITSMSVRTNKKGVATFVIAFIIAGKEGLQKLTEKIRQIEGVMDIERTAG